MVLGHCERGRELLLMLGFCTWPPRRQVYYPVLKRFRGSIETVK
jgi:hypothetical protein